MAGRGRISERFKYKIYLINLINKTKVVIMKEDMLEIGKISSRGQIAIPSNIRKNMGLEEGTKVLFFLEDDSIIIKKVTSETFANITRPLKEAAKKSGLRETDVDRIIHTFRKKRK